MRAVLGEGFLVIPLTIYCSGLAGRFARWVVVPDMVPGAHTHSNLEAALRTDPCAPLAMEMFLSLWKCLELQSRRDHLN